MSDEEVQVEEPKERLDHLNDVLNAQLTGDDDAAKASFHDYLTMTTQNILRPAEDPVEDEIEVEDVEAIDDVAVDDINIDDHLPVVEDDEELDDNEED